VSTPVTVIAHYTEFAPFIRSLEALRETGVRRFSVYSPVGLEDYEELLPTRGSIVPWISFGAGWTGAFLGFLMAIGSASLYGLIVGGKSYVAWLPYCIIAFEVTILTSAVVTLGAMIFKTRLYPKKLSHDYDAHFSSDEFGISVPCDEGECGDIIELLNASGASGIREI